MKPSEKNSKKTYKFLAMDPSLANTALVWGYITDGEIEPVDWILAVTGKSKNKQVRVSSDTVDRCKHTIGFINEVLEDWKPDICFAETPSGSKSSNAMKSYGVSCAYIALMNPPAIQVSPTELKQATVGKNTASKQEMMDWAESLHPDFPWERKKDGTMVVGRMEHVADAIGAAYAGIQTDQYAQIAAYGR